jgi:hypothetical protein
MTNPFKYETQGKDGTEANSFLIGTGHDILSKLHAAANATSVAFGKIQGGTPIGLITATDEVRPCGKALITAAAGPVNVVTVGSTANLRVGDIIDVYDVSGEALLADGVNITALTATTVTFDGAAITVAIGDIVRLDNGAETCIGITYKSENTARDIDYDATPPTLINTSVGVQYFSNGSVRRSGIVGLNTLIEADLPAVNFVTR